MKKILSILLAIVMLTGCIALAEEPAVTTDYDSLVVASTTTMSGNFFNSMFGYDAADTDVWDLIHGYNLMRFDADTGAYGIDPSVVSGIAAFEGEDGSHTYTINLYHDLSYSDGTPITAWDYAFSLLLYACPEIREIGGGTLALDYIKGVADYRTGNAETITGVTVASDYQISITVSAEYIPYFYELGALNINPYPISEIAPGCEMADDGNGIYIRNSDTAVTDTVFTADLLRTTLLDAENGYVSHPKVTSGPYVLTSWDSETHTATFTANEHYKGNYDGVVPSIKNLTYTLTTNDTMIEELSNGTIGLINRAANVQSIQEGMSLTGDSNYDFINYARTGMTYVSFNCEKAAMSDVNVRQALTMCFDRQSFTTEMMGSYALVVNGYYGIGQWMYRLVNGEATLEDTSDMDEETIAAWESLNMDGIRVYELDIDGAAALLENAGWKLNADGLREKDGQVLDLTLWVEAGNRAVEPLQQYFIANAAQIGIRITLVEKTASDMFAAYYREADRTNDMFYMASNFADVFDPSVNFQTSDEAQGYDNRTGYRDDKLYSLALDMRTTESGDTLSYCTKWVAFQEYFSQVLPMMPVYSNVYFDFYTATLHDYTITSGQTWSSVIVYAYRGDIVEEEEETEEEVFEN